MSIRHARIGPCDVAGIAHRARRLEYERGRDGAFGHLRATFEMGNPHSAVLGVDPTVKSNLQKKLETSVLGLIYVLKVLIVGILIKTFLWQPFIPMKYFTWLGSHAPTVSSIFWDGLIGHVIMDQVELRASGVTASTEVRWKRP